MGNFVVSEDRKGRQCTVVLKFSAQIHSPKHCEPQAGGPVQCGCCSFMHIGPFLVSGHHNPAFAWCGLRQTTLGKTLSKGQLWPLVFLPCPTWEGLLEQSSGGPSVVPPQRRGQVPTTQHLAGCVDASPQSYGLERTPVKRGTKGDREPQLAARIMATVTHGSRANLLQQTP